MFLKQLSVFGFKSFAEKTEFEFVPGVTAVVGPNGSGKSNVTDALRWVLGEQSAKSLRGGTMEDIIFAGSDSRKQLNFAEVAITLDNQAGKLPIDYNEVSVKRRVYRSGESEFFINNQPCRLKDIVELFTDSGLGREAFSIISQGKVDQILNSKPEERRTIFEEAAGVLKYKHRKKKTEDKLSDTEENLHRVQDILHELDSQLHLLKEQAEAAQLFLNKQEEQKEVDIALIVYQMKSLYTKWEKVKEELEKQTDKEIQLVSDLQKLEIVADRDRQEQTRIDDKVNELQEELLSVSELLEKLEGQRQVLEEKNKNTERQMASLEENIKNAQDKKVRLFNEKLETETIIFQKETEINDLKNELKEKRINLSQFDDQIDQSIEILKSEYVDLLNEHASNKNELQYIEKQLKQQETRQEKLESDNEKYLEEKKQIEKLVDQNKGKLKDVRDQLEEANRQGSQMVEQVELFKKKHEQQQSLLFQSYRDTQRLKAEKESLESLEDDFAGYMQGVREVLKAKNKPLRGIEGTVAELVHVPKGLETAIEIALGGSVQHVVVQADADGREAIEYLKRNRLGRATFLPMNIIKPKQLYPNQLTLIRQEDTFVGIAAELVTYDKKYAPILWNLLGSVIVAKDLQGAGRLAKLLQHRFRIVTPAGDVINPGGSMSGGASKQKRSSLIARKSRLEQLKEKLSEQEAHTATLEDTVNELKRRIDAYEKRYAQYHKEMKELEARQYEWQSELTRLEINLKNTNDNLVLGDMEMKELANEKAELTKQAHEISSALRDREEHIQTMSEEIERLSVHRNELQQTKEQIMAETGELNVRNAALTEQHLAAKSNLARIQTSIEQLDHQISEAERESLTFKNEKIEIFEQISNIQIEIEKHHVGKQETLDQISQHRKLRMELQETVTHREAELKELTRQQKRLSDKVKGEELKANRLELEMENLNKVLNDDFSITFEHAEEQYPLTIPADEAEQRRNLLKQEILSIGTVNIGAIEEYERVNSRYQFLMEQQADLEQAKQTLFQIMDEMDQEMTKRFKQTFHSIQQAFQGVFSSLFGGGKAELKLTEPEDMLNTGVEIIAQPPGKKLQNLSLLSGGERSLTAIALLFSILKVRPVPFCVLDEVEAALDEANVSRFSNYLKKFSENTQFIVITHRQGTMAGADVLYGITMQESGVSKLVSVRLEDNKMMAQI